MIHCCMQTVDYCYLLPDRICFHCQGKCSVIKALDLRVPPRPTRPRRITTNGDIYIPLGLLRRKRRTQSDPSKIWIKELEESLKTPFSFNESNKVDENQEDDERQVYYLICNVLFCHQIR